jgi:hypothetical protein
MRVILNDIVGTWFLPPQSWRGLPRKICKPGLRNLWNVISSTRSYGETGIPPGCHPAIQGLDVGKTLLLIFSRQTGGRVLVGSGAIKNDLLVFGQGRNFGEEFRGQQGPGQMNSFAVVITGISTNQEALPGLYPGMALCGGYAGNHSIFLFKFSQKINDK